MSLVSIRDLSRNPIAVVHEGERSGRPALVTRNGKPIVALVRIEQDKLKDWLLWAVANLRIGVSLEESPGSFVGATKATASTRNLDQRRRSGFAMATHSRNTLPAGANGWPMP